MSFTIFGSVRPIELNTISGEFSSTFISLTSYLRFFFLILQIAGYDLDQLVSEQNVESLGQISHLSIMASGHRRAQNADQEVHEQQPHIESYFHDIKIEELRRQVE